MGHRAVETFFDEKLGWSERKDRILGSYLTAYVSKVAKLNRPILLVDGFAGAGMFNDGSLGSPLIMLEAARSSSTAKTKILAIEANDSLFARLAKNVANIPEVQAVHSEFLAQISRIEEASKSHSVFMYLDPFTAKGLDDRELRRVFSMVQRGHSIEYLVNFQAPIFARWALKAVGRSLSDAPADEIPSTPEIEQLDAIVGGDWWRGVAAQASEFDALVRSIVDGYCGRLLTTFSQVCFHEVFAKSSHKVPKYVLIFGSRHPDALLLMNDEMVKSKHTLVREEAASRPQGSLFERVDEAPIEDANRLPDLVRLHLKAKMPRGDLILAVVRENFGVYKKMEVRGAIENLINTGEILTATGRKRINDEEFIWKK